MNFFLEQNNKLGFWAKINLYINAGEHEAAERAVELEISRKGRTSEYLFFLGVIKHYGEDYPSAIKLWQESLDRDPRNTQSFLALAITLSDLGDVIGLENIIGKLRQIDGFDPLSLAPVTQAEAIKYHLQMASLLEESGQLEAGIQEASRALTYDPSNYQAHLSMGRILYNVKDYKKSQDHLEKCDRIAKERGDHLVLLAMINYLAHRNQLASQYLQRVPESHRDFAIAQGLIKII